MEKFLSVGEVSRRLNARRTRDVPDLITREIIPASAYILASGRRLVREEALPIIQQELAKRGWIKASPTAQGVGNGK